WEAALADCGAALAARPGWVSALLLRAGLGERLDRAEEARRDYAEALAAAPTAETHLRSILEAGIARAAVEAAPDTPGWRRTLARTARRVGDGEYAPARRIYKATLTAADAALRAATGGPNPAAPHLLSGLRTEVATAHFNLACISALAAVARRGPGTPAGPPLPAAEATAAREAAFLHLRTALDLVPALAERLRQDPDLAPLNGDPRWGDLVRGAPAAPVAPAGPEGGGDR
ncbi:MAG: hypothetical protein HZA54_14600, partial [Planctomycetes bacterium]|nr:hypothetical protein [Planctomycetota bacterium]